MTDDEAEIESFRLVVERHDALVYRFLYGLVGNADTARELAQETFYRALRYGSASRRGALIPRGYAVSPEMSG
jgi:DNA-directed RNA polymerase specialized sigma24 family protein